MHGYPWQITPECISALFSLHIGSKKVSTLQLRNNLSNYSKPNVIVTV